MPRRTGRRGVHEIVERSFAHSLCFGVYEDGRQIGFARVVTDRAVFAYLMDVFVLPEHRGHGVGESLIRAVLDHPDLQGLRLFAVQRSPRPARCACRGCRTHRVSPHGKLAADVPRNDDRRVPCGTSTSAAATRFRSGKTTSIIWRRCCFDSPTTPKEPVYAP